MHCNAELAKKNIVTIKLIIGKYMAGMINQRVRDMFHFSLKENEVFRCLEKCRALLILAGAKDRNFPANHEKRIAFMSELNDKSSKIISRWISENINFDGVADAVHACDELERNYSLSNADKIKDPESLWKAVLFKYVDEKRPPYIDEFFKERKNLVRTLHAVDTKKIDVIETENNDVQRHQVYSGFSIKDQLKKSDLPSCDPHELPVLGFGTKELPTKQFFIKLLALVHSENIYQLLLDDAKKFFPESGDAAGFPTPHNELSFDEGISIWRVQRGQGNYDKTQFVIESHVSNVYDVFYIPHTSSQPDKVRTWIETQYFSKTRVYPVFQLSDGLIIKFSSDIRNPEKANFDIPLNAYFAHEAVVIHNKNAVRTLVIKPFPVADFKYDIAPLKTQIKRFFSNRALISGFPVITKAQLQALAEVVNTEADDKLTKTSALRVMEQVHEIVDTKELFVEVLDELLKLPMIKEKVDTEVERKKEEIVSVFRAQKTKEEIDVLALRATKKNLEDELERLKKANRKENADLAKEIKKTFDRASAEGIQTISNLALFKSVFSMQSEAKVGIVKDNFSDNEEKSGFQKKLNSPENWSASLVGSELSSIVQLKNAIALTATSNGVSANLLNAVLASSAAQGVLALVGANQKKIVSVLSNVVAQRIFCSVSVTGDMFGPSDLLNAAALVESVEPRAMTLGEFIEDQQKMKLASIILLRGVNRSAPESFLPELLNAARYSQNGKALSWTDRRGNIRLIQLRYPIIFIMDFTVGRSIFPILAPMAFEVSLFDTDASWGDEEDEDPDTLSKATYVSREVWQMLIGDSTLESQHQLFSKMSDVTTSAARRMKYAASSIGVSGLAAELIALVGYGAGRYDTNILMEKIDNADMKNAFDVEKYFEGIGQNQLNHIFDTTQGNS
jgi:hypothetical protein